MWDNFFQLHPLPVNQMLGTYDYRLVILSYLVATLASYIALDITGRLRDLSNTNLSTTLWLLGGAIAMGSGIWSMHFIGMLAFSIPSMTMVYNVNWTGISMVVAVAASGFALGILSIKKITNAHIVLGGIILGLAIASMHYTGMEAMKTDMDIHYLPFLFSLSIIIAIIASQVALWLALKSTVVVATLRFRLKFVSAFIMGAAICGMHYTGMSAAVFTHNLANHLPLDAAGLSPQMMSITIASVSFIILGVAFIASTYKESLNQQLLLTARQAGMAEVASTVLHNVGNILNSVNVSSGIIAEKIAQSKLSELSNLNALLFENQHNLAEFIKNDPRGSHLPKFIHSLSEYWVKEKEALTHESALLSKNVEHIRNIIATQQDFSRTVTLVQLESIDKILEEALLISAIEDPNNKISLSREYATLKPVLLDKVKFLQILVNLLQNAKEALNESHNPKKALKILSSHDNHEFIIQVSDNGNGILPQNLTRIFAYGFTTKAKGHGFGLHSSAISASEMGGSLAARSEGVGKGSVFILKLPYR